MDGNLPTGPTTTRDAVVDLAATVGRLVLAVTQLQTAVLESTSLVNAAELGDADAAASGRTRLKEALKASAESSNEAWKELLTILERLGDRNG